MLSWVAVVCTFSLPCSIPRVNVPRCFRPVYVAGCLDCFQFFAIVSKALVTFSDGSFGGIYVSISVVYTPGVDLERGRGWGIFSFALTF